MPCNRRNWISIGKRTPGRTRVSGSRRWWHCYSFPPSAKALWRDRAHAADPCASSGGAGWDDLWLTPDQQGARHLSAGEASDAARAFADTNWRGVAEYEAGSYDQAAKSFAGETTADNLYNLGNSLALQEIFAVRSVPMRKV